MQHLISRRQLLKSAAVTAAGLVLFRDALTAEERPSLPAIGLDANENPYGMSQGAARAIEAELTRASRYPFREVESLRDLIAAHEKVPTQCVIVGAGCTEVFSLACLLYGANGKGVVVPEPNYFLFNRYVTQVRGRLLKVPVDGHWRTDLDAMGQQTPGDPGLTYVCNPNNPTGTVVERTRLRRFCEESARRSVVFVDEAYYELVEAPLRATMVELVREARDLNLVVGRTFSKLYGLAGLRIGYGIGNPAVIAEMCRLQESPSTVSRLSIAAAKAAYVDTDYVASIRQRNAQVRARFYETLDTLGCEVIPGSQANFVTFRRDGNERRLIADLRERYGIRVRASHFMDKDWVRVSMGTPEQMGRLAKGLRVLLA
jgi:histidinol-phosphate aminotransferase